MSTAYNNSSASAMTGTAAALGEDFVLSTGSSRTFFTVPAIGSTEGLTLQIKQASGSDYVDVGSIIDGKLGNTGVVTARGEGNSTFRVNKSATAVSTAVFYD